MMELSNCFQCVMHEADTHFLLAFLVSGLLVQDTWSQIVDMDHKSETSFTSCHIYAARVKQKIYCKPDNFCSSCLVQKYNCLQIGAFIQSLQESVNCGFNWTMSNLPF